MKKLFLLSNILLLILGCKKQEIKVNKGLLDFKDLSIFKMTLQTLDDEANQEFFEKKFSNFFSLRKKIEIEEENWLNNPVPDYSKDPDNHFIVDENVRAVLNIYEEVKIGNSIYKFYEDGYIEITDGDFDKLDKIRKIFVQTKTKSGWVKGHHKSAGGITFSSTLT